MAQFVMYEPITIDRFHKAFVSQYVKDNRKNMPDYGRKKTSEAAMNEARDFKKPVEYNTTEEYVFTSYGQGACGAAEEYYGFDGYI